MNELASSPGHSHILSPRLRDKIWEWPGDKTMNEPCKLECSYHAWMSLITYYVGVTAKDVDVVELHDCFSTNELITYEALVSYIPYVLNCKYHVLMYISLADSVMYILA